MEDQLGPLVQQAEQAWKDAHHAREAADRADQEVKDRFFGEYVVVTGRTTHEINNGSLFERRKQLTEQPAYVPSLFYYENSDYGRRNVLRIITPDGIEWQLLVTGTQMILAKESVFRAEQSRTRTA